MTDGIITEQEEIPYASYYVTSTDTFMSGWWHADGKDNVIILPTDSLDEAEIVAENARNRSDQKNVRILHNKPTLNLDKLYSLLTKETANNWYRPGMWTAD